MKKTILINGVYFECCGEIEEPAFLRISDRNIFDCYSHPSCRKINIWKSWCRWFGNTDVVVFGIRSYNCNFFTIEGIIEISGDRYYLEITYAHCRAFKLV